MRGREQREHRNVTHDRCSSAFNVFVFGFENGQTQLQKWELKFVTELEPLERASPVCLFGEKIGLLWKNVWLHVLKL